MTDQIDIRHLLIFLTDKRRDERAWRRQALASRAEGSDDRSNQRATKEGKTWSGVSEPSSQQRVSVKAVKGGGKEKEDFFLVQNVIDIGDMIRNCVAIPFRVPGKRIHEL